MPNSFKFYCGLRRNRSGKYPFYVHYALLIVDARYDLALYAMKNAIINPRHPGYEYVLVLQMCRWLY